MPSFGPPTEFEINYDRDRHIPLSDDQRIGLGSLILEFYIEKALDMPAGYSPIDAATQWLENIGFDTVDTVQLGDDIMYIALRRLPADDFILEFAGHDAADISLYNHIRTESR